MAPGTQLVFLYLYYLQTTDTVNLTQISRDLLLSKATCTRAIDDLTVSGLITYKTEGTNKWISPSFNKPEFLKKGYPRLKSPVERLIYVRTPFHDSALPKSGVLALADISMVGANEQDGATAISKKPAHKSHLQKLSLSRISGILEGTFLKYGAMIRFCWQITGGLMISHCC